MNTGSRSGRLSSGQSEVCTGGAPDGVAAFHLCPTVDRLAAHLKSSTRLFMDETTAPVLDHGRWRTKTGYLWALARDDR